MYTIRVLKASEWTFVGSGRRISAGEDARPCDGT